MVKGVRTKLRIKRVLFVVIGMILIGALVFGGITLFKGKNTVNQIQKKLR